MVTEEVRRKKAAIKAKLDEVIVDNDGAVRAVAMAVQEMNHTTAVQAAWAEERFDKVDEWLNGVDQKLDKVDQRLNVLEIGQCDIRSAMSRTETAIREDMRMREGTLVWHMAKSENGIRKDMADMECRLRADIDEMRVDMTGKFNEVSRKFDEVDVNVAGVDNNFSVVRGDIAKLTARVEQVLAFAVRDETTVAEVADEATE